MRFRRSCIVNKLLVGRGEDICIRYLNLCLERLPIINLEALKCDNLERSVIHPIFVRTWYRLGRKAVGREKKKISLASPDRGGELRFRSFPSRRKNAWQPWYDLWQQMICYSWSEFFRGFFVFRDFFFVF